jgi:7-carboxy-7-deazaguanine synthase
MSKLHYTELFYSIQGEGRYQGVPSVFLRTFGCNFRCRNFGRDRNDTSDNQEVLDVIKNIDQYKTFKDLPLVKTGCDSYSSVYPEFKSFVTHSDSDAIVERIMEILPNGRWQDEHLVITGGEPLLGWQRAYQDLLSHPKMQNLKEITFETNGTQALSKELMHYLLDWTLNSRHGRRGSTALTFSVSAKLSGSGESRAEAIKPSIVNSYAAIGYTYLKFVVATEEDIQEAIMITGKYRDEGFTGPVYLMPVGGVESVYSLNNRRIAQAAMQHGLRYSDRLQVPLFKNEWGT